MGQEKKRERKEGRNVLTITLKGKEDRATSEQT